MVLRQERTGGFELREMRRKGRLWPEMVQKISWQVFRLGGVNVKGHPVLMFDSPPFAMTTGGDFEMSAVLRSSGISSTFWTVLKY
jgi:hypothetical protein